MTEELDRLLAARAESDRLECKSQLRGVEDDVRKTICALANDLAGHGQPGYIVFGIENDTWRHSGLTVDQTLIERLSQFPHDGTILPPPAVDVGMAAYEGRTIAYLKVHPSAATPLRYKGLVYVRVGSLKRLATPEEERRLSEKRRHRDKPFDQQPVESARLEDLDLDFFRSTYLPAAVARETLRENERGVEDRLVSCRFLAPDRRTPTVAGLLVTGMDPQAWLPGAYIQFVRFDGSDVTEPTLDEKQLTGTLYRQARLVEDVVTVNVFRRLEVQAGKLRRTELPDYPTLAIRELVLNALVHRTYEGTNAPVRIFWFADRVEILSPGGLFGQVTPENFKFTTDYRNPTLAEAMKVLGYTERFGVGIQRVYRALRENGNPEPEFDFRSPTHVLVTVRRREP